MFDSALKTNAKAILGALTLVVLLAGPQPLRAADELSSCTDNSRACLVASVMSYIHGAMLRDPSKIRFAPNFRATFESQGTISESSAADLRKAFSPATTFTAETRKYLESQNVAVPALEGAEVQKFLAAQVYRAGRSYVETTLVDESAGEVVVIWGYGSTKPARTSKAFERFKVVNGLITELEAVDISRDESIDKGTGWPADQGCLKVDDNGKLVSCS